MHLHISSSEIPTYSLEPDNGTGNRHFRMYHFDGERPNLGDLLVPHRKDHYLVILVRKGGQARQWIDMKQYSLQDNTLHFLSPGQLIVKEESAKITSVGVGFTPEFLSMNHHASLADLPLLRNPHDARALTMSDADIVFTEDLFAKIAIEYKQPGEWQHRMLISYLSVLLTYLSRLYSEQHKATEISPERTLLKNFQAKVNESFRELHEVSDYAAKLNISAGHLSEVVKVQSGKSAIKHIHERITLEARRLLFHSSHSLKEIAFSLGFSDPSYFNRFFKRETGLTPSDYRTSTREMYQ
ncbi:AraC family transcriptional regulator [Chryseobacterium kwangjuense]|uniref:AraC family transcriptional regulator n=1 Tax=Chryseobacterium kwangjuense TaxID=267125 RepID=A0A135W4D1_9FLAO|nr:helix-turn-helix domain-containing protein [Chryseobacterium kwangjuense]KXH79699.1 AraC family transcriptional regulator [Chryseobacterium kwangjuense]